MYRKAFQGELPNFTGVSDPYEPPLAPEIVVQTSAEMPTESVAKILAELSKLNQIDNPSVTVESNPHQVVG